MSDPYVKMKPWQVIGWWLTWRIWRPLRRRCSWCGFRFVSEDEFDSFDWSNPSRDEVGTRHTYLGFGAWACYGCCEYGEG